MKDIFEKVIGQGIIMMRHFNGLTLIEFVLVLAIIGSTTMMVIPIFESTSKGTSVESEAYRLQSFIYNAKRESARTGKEHVICYNLELNSFAVLSANSDENKSQFQLHLDGNVYVKKTNSEGVIVSFDKKGETSNEAEIVLYGKWKKAFLIKISAPSGDVSVLRKN